MAALFESDFIIYGKSITSKTEALNSAPKL